jgi:hypothetical protein
MRMNLLNFFFLNFHILIINQLFSIYFIFKYFLTFIIQWSIFHINSSIYFSTWENPLSSPSHINQHYFISFLFNFLWFVWMCPTIVFYVCAYVRISPAWDEENFGWCLEVLFFFSIFLEEKKIFTNRIK